MKLVVQNSFSKEDLAPLLVKVERSLFFHTPNYINYLSRHLDAEFKIALVKTDAGETIGALPYATKEGPLGVIINSLPYYGSNGGIIATSEEAKKMLWSYWRELSEKAASSTYITTPFLEDSLPPESTANTLVSSRITHINELPQSKINEALFEGYHYKTRNMVRKAIKSAVTVQKDNADKETLYRLHVENMAAVGGRAKKQEFFFSIDDFFKPDADYTIHYAYVNGEKVAGLLTFYGPHVAEYFTPVIQHEHREFQPLSLLIHTVMTEAAERGLKYWNWGGTWPSQTSLLRFKERWGGREGSYMYYTVVNNPEIFKVTRQTLESHYADFFVVPYERLQGA